MHVSIVASFVYVDCPEPIQNVDPVYAEHQSKFLQPFHPKSLHILSNMMLVIVHLKCNFVTPLMLMLQSLPLYDMPQSKKKERHKNIRVSLTKYKTKLIFNV